jgi:DNA-binding FadR family transcriptional regulator
MAIDHITDDEMAELEVMLEKYREMIPTASNEEFDHIDYTFHYKLCLAGHNEIEKQIFLEWVQLIYISIRENNRIQNHIMQNREWSYLLHRRLLDAIRKKDLTMCIELYKEMCARIALTFPETSDK